MTRKKDELQDVRPLLIPDGFTIHFNEEGGGIRLGDIDALDDKLPAFEHQSSLGVNASIRFKFKCWQVRKDFWKYVTAASIDCSSLIHLVEYSRRQVAHR